jgi:hypothetical protein
MRKYGIHAEDPNRCVAVVKDTRYTEHQCRRKRGHGHDRLYCKQHAQVVEKAKHSETPSKYALQQYAKWDKHMSRICRRKNGG